VRRSEFKICLREGGEIYEMDVSPCNSLLDLWFIVLVLSKTLNGSSEGKKTREKLKGRQFFAGLFYSFWEKRLYIRQGL
jgi:hypothetical protein